ncbi:hypothetical protein [Ruminococcus sp.]|uniref:hypothetical protein n=1 Tax=Ruminococcus sp. TaxID=41978 RepID=UPI0025FA87DD|nr:hypothetical protein [Ruminococcus sp.]
MQAEKQSIKNPPIDGRIVSAYHFAELLSDNRVSTLLPENNIFKTAKTRINPAFR